MLAVLNLILHTLSLGILGYFTKPIADWYLSRVPALGIDLYNSVTHAALHQRHFSFWFNGFKDVWFGGYHLVGDFSLVIKTPAARTS